MDCSLWQPSDSLKDLHICEVIGNGKHSKVHKIRKKRTIGYFALRISEKSERQKLMMEVRALHSLCHKNIIRFFMWYETNNHLWTITEYCVGGSLAALLKADKSLPEASVHDFGRDIARALRFLHSQSILHCDLRPENILLDENGCIKVAGFGMSRTMNQTDDNSTSPVNQGSIHYMSPELLEKAGAYSVATDLWALGCTLYAMATGHPPPTSSSDHGPKLEMLSSSQTLELGENRSTEFHDLVQRLLVKTPADRMGWSEMQNHSFWQYPIEDPDMLAL